MSEPSGFARVAVVGGGAWGTALANAAAAAGREVVLWMRDGDAARAMAETRENARFLPGICLDARLSPTADPGALAGAEAVLLVTPAQTLRDVLADLSGALPRGAPTVLCAKGIERGTNAFLTDVAAAALPSGTPLVVLSGPGFAADVARGLPTAVTLASADADLAARLAAALSGQALRIYHSGDPRGVEIGGAAKNVLAIACGAVIGRGLGESARAALVARSFAELMRFAFAYGGRPETLMGLSGLGDLVLTAASPQSRNFAFGLRLGEGRTAEEAAQGRLAEGAHTAGALLALARARSVEMPVAAAVADVVAGRRGIDAAVEALMRRPLRAEHEGRG